MGYESRLYVIEKSTMKGCEEPTKDMVWGQVIATFDLCKVYAVSDKMRYYPKTDAYIYLDGMEEPCVEDWYGEPLKEVPLADAIKIVREAAENDEYRRLKPCLSLLEGFETEKWRELVVLHYGH